MDIKKIIFYALAVLLVVGFFFMLMLVKGGSL